MQERLPARIEHCPIKIALVTARNAPADLRAIKTLREWGVDVDMAFFLGGLEKTSVLKTFAPHIFFDDSIQHINAARNFVPTALVPYHSTSLLHADSLLSAVKNASSLTFSPAKQTIFAANN